MSTISAVSSASSAWSEVRSARASARQDKMFAKVDSDASGTVDKTELQGLLDHVAEKSGNTLGSADDLMTRMDSDSDGSLSQDELEAGMKSLMPEPKSTVDFAQQRDGGGPDGPPPPPPPDDASAGASTSRTSTSTDPLDTNADGTVSAQERAAGAMQDVLKALMAAIDTDDDNEISKSEADVFKSQLDTAVSSLKSGSSAGSSSSSGDSASASSQQDSLNLSALASLVLRQYGAAAANQSQTSTFSVAA